MWSDLKSKQQNKMRQFNYYNLMENELISMFEYKNMDYDLYRAIETYLIRDGLCAIGQIDGKLTAVRGGLCGNVDVYGYGTQFAWACPNHSGTWERDTECVVFINNHNMMPDFQIDRYSSFLSDIDVSLHANVQNSRLAPIMIANDEKSKKGLLTAFENVKQGNFSTVLSDNILNDKGLYTIDLTNPQASSYLQYLTQFKTDIIKEVYALYGFNLNNSGKRAQVTTEELAGLDKVCEIYPMERLMQRKRAIEKVNNLFGSDYSVEFSEVFKREKEENLTNIEDQKESDNNESESEKDEMVQD